MLFLPKTYKGKLREILARCEKMNPLRYAVMMAVALIVTALMVPLGLQQIATANMTGVNTAVASVFTIVLPILVIVGLALSFMPPELKSKIGM